jgi:hypothetical protein
MTRAAVALIVLQAAAVCKEPVAKKGVVVSEANGTVTMEIGSTDDFFAVDAKFSQLVYGPSTRTQTLEVVLRPGEYKMSLQLDDTLRGRLSLHVRSADPAHPAVFDNARVSLYGIDVTIEDLVFRNWHQAMTVLDLTVKNSLTVRRCVIADNHNPDKRGGNLVRFMAAYGTGAKTALIEDCLFARNSETKAKPENMIIFGVGSTDFFQTVRFERTAFVENQFSCDVSPGRPKELRFQDCVIVKPAGGVLADLWAKETNLIVDSSTLVLDSWQSLAHVKETSQPISIQHSAVYADGAPPANVKLDSAARDRHEAAALVSRLQKLASQPHPPLGAALEKALAH